MKRLVCRKCGGSFFKFRKNDSCMECFKCKSPIKIMDFNDNNNVNYLSILWKTIPTKEII